MSYCQRGEVLKIGGEKHPVLSTSNASFGTVLEFGPWSVPVYQELWFCGSIKWKTRAFVFQWLHAELASHSRAPEDLFKHWGHFSHPHCCWPLSIYSHCEFTTEQTLVWNTHFIYKTELSTTSAYCRSKNLIHTLTANNSYTHHDYCVCNRNDVFLHQERPQGFRLCLLGTYMTPARHRAI